MNLPMDVDLDFKWEVCQPRKLRHCEYLSPIKRKRVDLDCTEIMKYIPKNTKQDTFLNTKSTISKKLSFNISFSVIYKYLFIITDLLLSLVVLYVVLQLFFFLQKDIRHKLKVKNYELKKVIEDAVNNYKINKCHKSTRVPALNQICSEWECVIQNGSIKYTSVIFEVMGDVCNGFIDRVSWKSVGVLSLFLVIYLKFRNK